MSQSATKNNMTLGNVNDRRTEAPGMAGREARAVPWGFVAVELATRRPPHADGGTQKSAQFSAAIAPKITGADVTAKGRRELRHIWLDSPMLTNGAEIKMPPV
jgi:hypothetical protein